MGFNNHKTKEITVDNSRSKGDYIYLSNPRGIRVNKDAMIIEVYDRKLEDYKPAKFTKAGMKGNYYPAVLVNKNLYNAIRIIATLFVPNPNNYNYVYSPNHSLDPNLMQWIPTPCKSFAKQFVTSNEARNELSKYAPGSKEYTDAYNKLKGSDGLTNSQRFIKRMKDAGYVLLNKKYSPTRRSVWVTPTIKSKVITAFNAGLLNNKTMAQIFIDEINALPKHNKPYKDTTSFEARKKIILKGWNQ
jgi:hypothetical protein